MTVNVEILSQQLGGNNYHNIGLTFLQIGGFNESQQHVVDFWSYLSGIILVKEAELRNDMFTFTLALGSIHDMFIFTEV